MSHKQDVEIWRGILAAWKTDSLHTAQLVPVHERTERQAAVIDHNRRMQLLRVQGDAYRDRLVRERLNLRKGETS
jgi:hypothetical protein